ncbi:DNA binding protein, putative isoform 1 [Cucumis melo var. makuwa]|uniref:DNA binding protein n=2 Tax=Cucumis melo TaxID=3656 RepID=A0A9I9CW83_CUCME|nr:DNA binding protein, putative isoform 1 [Cucumis melo var. makuwa]TYK25240.1 DNA binding protein, putative isoform 1 [Cucumis melo var. makuwa]
MEELQSPPEPSSTDITSNKGRKKPQAKEKKEPEKRAKKTSNKGKKKPPAKEKKEPEKRAKKKTPVATTTAAAATTTSTSVNEHQRTDRLNDVLPKVKVSEFDPCVENHFRAMDAIVELCCEAEEGDGGIDESDIQRFSSSTIFLREWRFYNYEAKTIKFANDSTGPEGKDADITINLPQFSSAAVLKKGAPPGASTSLDFRNFAMHVGGPVWAIDWCPQVHGRTNSLIKCEFIAVSAHPPGSSYHKMGIPLTGRGMVQIWCLVHGTENYEPIDVGEPPSDLSSQPKKPRGRPPGRKKKEASGLPSPPKRPRGRPKKEQKESTDKKGDNCQLVQEFSMENPVGSSSLLEIDGVPKNTENFVLLENNVERERSTLQEVSTCNSEDEVPAKKRRVRRKVKSRNLVDDVGVSSLTEYQEDGSIANNHEADENVKSEYSGEDNLLCKDISENVVLDASSIEFSIPESVALPRVVLCLAHNGKVAWDLKWKPINACTDNCKHRMGYLAVLLGNGSLEVWEVPFPHAVKTIYSKFNGEGTDPRFVKLKPIFRCSRLRTANTQSIPLTVEWSLAPPYDYLLAGCHDGTVALWKFSANSSCEDTRPLLRFSADTVPIRAVAWAPSESNLESANVILTAGHGGLKFWDLRDPFRPLWDLHPAPRIIYSLDWLPNPRCVFLSFDDGTLRLLSLLKAANDVPATGQPFTAIKQKGLHTYICSSYAIWSIQVSRQTGMVAYCGADGAVVRFQLTTKAADKENSRHRTPHYVCEYLTEEESIITFRSPPPNVPIPLKKLSNKSEHPLSMRAILSDSMQSNEGNHKTATASTLENEASICSDVDVGVESGSEDTPLSTKKKNRTQPKCKKKGVENLELECNVEPKDDAHIDADVEAQTDAVLEARMDADVVPSSGDHFENLPPKSVAMHRVRWNMNMGSEKWLCYGGASGILRCQEMVLSALDMKLMKKK